MEKPETVRDMACHVSQRLRPHWMQTELSVLSLEKGISSPCKVQTCFWRNIFWFQKGVPRTVILSCEVHALDPWDTKEDSSRRPPLEEGMEKEQTCGEGLAWLFLLQSLSPVLWFLFQKVEVQAPPGQTAGYVYQSWSICSPKFKICDATDSVVLRIEGPCCTCNICGDVEFQVCPLLVTVQYHCQNVKRWKKLQWIQNGASVLRRQLQEHLPTAWNAKFSTLLWKTKKFPQKFAVLIYMPVQGLSKDAICMTVLQVYSADGETPVGQIRKQWSGIIKEYFTDTDNFGITFPMDLDVNIKATLLGACFLIVSSELFWCTVVVAFELAQDLFRSMSLEFINYLLISGKVLNYSCCFQDFMFFERDGNKRDDGLNVGMFWYIEVSSLHWNKHGWFHPQQETCGVLTLQLFRTIFCFHWVHGRENISATWKIVLSCFPILFLQVPVTSVNACRLNEAQQSAHELPFCDILNSQTVRNVHTQRKHCDIWKKWCVACVKVVFVANRQNPDQGKNIRKRVPWNLWNPGTSSCQSGAFLLEFWLIFIPSQQKWSFTSFGTSAL